MKIAVIGASGQLGNDLVRVFADRGEDVYGLTHGDIEISNADSVSSKLRELRPDIIVNTAAMHNVEQCEQRPEEAFLVNAVGARNLATTSRDLHALLMHVSTDYVFDGNKGRPYDENDLPRPLSVYGNSKLAGEYFVQCTADRFVILRTSGLYGKSPCRAKGGLNFVELMLKLAAERPEVRVVDDEFVSPTCTLELAKQIAALSRSDCHGLYHATAEESCSWYQFASEIFQATGTKVKLQVASSKDFPAKVPRPKYSVLENRALKLNGINTLKPWRAGLHEYLGVAKN